MHHGQRESCRYRGIDGIAAGLHDLYADMRRQFVHADHDRVRGMNRVRRGRGGIRSARYH
jgi:hypothetical protein